MKAKPAATKPRAYVMPVCLTPAEVQVEVAKVANLPITRARRKELLWALQLQLATFPPFRRGQGR
jgi:hypothetical protein